jgi:hypothetical protein
MDGKYPPHLSIINIPTNRQFKEEETDASGKSLEATLQQVNSIEYSPVQ